MLPIFSCTSKVDCACIQSMPYEIDIMLLINYNFDTFIPIRWKTFASFVIMLYALGARDSSSALWPTTSGLKSFLVSLL